MSQPLPADQIVRDYLDRIENWQSLSDAELTASLVYAFELEVCNGGFHQFFLNPSGDKWEETLRAIKTIEALRIAAMFEKALTVFPEQKPSKDHRQRERELKAAGVDAETKLWELDGEYYALHKAFPDEDSYAKLAAYIASH